jgi:hypothetical protein
MKKEDRIKLYNNSFKIFFWIMLITFVTLYISQATGYYEYELHKKVILTEEKIKQFEKDVADGKNVSIENYLENTSKNYNNKTSNAGYILSSTIGKYVRIGIEETFKVLNKLIEG